jgi:Cdc6-like AAA superfamily ATPase
MSYLNLFKARISRPEPLPVLLISGSVGAGKTSLAFYMSKNIKLPSFELLVDDLLSEDPKTCSSFLRSCIENKSIKNLFFKTFYPRYHRKVFLLDNVDDLIRNRNEQLHNPIINSTKACFYTLLDCVRNGSADSSLIMTTNLDYHLIDKAVLDRSILSIFLFFICSHNVFIIYLKFTVKGSTKL